MTTICLHIRISGTFYIKTFVHIICLNKIKTSNAHFFYGPTTKLHNRKKLDYSLMTRAVSFHMHKKHDCRQCFPHFLKKSGWIIHSNLPVVSICERSPVCLSLCVSLVINSDRFHGLHDKQQVMDERYNKRAYHLHICSSLFWLTFNPPGTIFR